LKESARGEALLNIMGLLKEQISLDGAGEIEGKKSESL